MENHWYRGEKKLKHEHMEQLYLELSTLEDRGITIWLDGFPSNSDYVTKQLNINDENIYMRDYVFDEGKLSEVHFDKVEKTNSVNLNNY